MIATLGTFWAYTNTLQASVNPALTLMFSSDAVTLRKIIRMRLAALFACQATNLSASPLSAL